MRKRTSLACLVLAACLALAGCGGAASAPSTSAAASVAATPAATATPEPTATAEPTPAPTATPEPDPEALRAGQEIWSTVEDRFDEWYTLYHFWFIPLASPLQEIYIGGYPDGYYACDASFSLEGTLFPCLEAFYTPEKAAAIEEELLAGLTAEYTYDPEESNYPPRLIERDGVLYTLLTDRVDWPPDPETAVLLSQEGNIAHLRIDEIADPDFVDDDYSVYDLWYVDLEQIDGVWYVSYIGHKPQ